MDITMEKEAMLPFIRFVFGLIFMQFMLYGCCVRDPTIIEVSDDGSKYVEIVVEDCGAASSYKSIVNLHDTNGDINPVKVGVINGLVEKVAWKSSAEVILKGSFGPSEKTSATKSGITFVLENTRE